MCVFSNSDTSGPGATALAVQLPVQGGQNNNSVANCIGACNSFAYPVAGLELAGECWCGPNIGNGTVQIDPNICNMTCPGDTTEICGGTNAILVYYDPNGV
ncbi:WSC domain-containing protein [Lactarius quietus]|nr:WSC domain-containing protein [Lactarius quietus]